MLFLCTHNSARSQMAEAILRQRSGGEIETSSAGAAPSRVHPLAIRAMAERDIDISGQRSKHMDELLEQRFDVVITVCDDANEACPVFPGAPRRIHWSVPDPSAVEGDDDKRANAFRAAAADLEGRIDDLLSRIRWGGPD